MTLLWLRLTITTIICLIPYAMSAGQVKPIPVEIWVGGDDGLTLRLRDKLENAFASSPEFNLRGGKKPGTLIVAIPTHVEWKQVNGRTKVFYKINFRSANDQNISVRKGACWDDTLTECAAQILKNAKVAARKIH
jgi:hypothetical protein